MGWWPFGRGSGAEPIGTPVAAAPEITAVRPAWTTMPVIQRAVAPIRPVAPLDAFTESLVTARNPAFLGPLGHAVSDDIGAGEIGGLARPLPVDVAGPSGSGSASAADHSGAVQAPPAGSYAGFPLPVAQRAAGGQATRTASGPRLLPALPALSEPSAASATSATSVAPRSLVAAPMPAPFASAPVVAAPTPVAVQRDSAGPPATVFQDGGGPAADPVAAYASSAPPDPAEPVADGGPGAVTQLAATAPDSAGIHLPSGSPPAVAGLLGDRPPPGGTSPAATDGGAAGAVSVPAATALPLSAPTPGPSSGPARGTTGAPMSVSRSVSDHPAGGPPGTSAPPPNPVAEPGPAAPVASSRRPGLGAPLRSQDLDQPARSLTTLASSAPMPLAALVQRMQQGMDASAPGGAPTPPAAGDVAAVVAGTGSTGSVSAAPDAPLGAPADAPPDAPLDAPLLGGRPTPAVGPDAPGERSVPWAPTVAPGTPVPTEQRLPTAPTLPTVPSARSASPTSPASPASPASSTAAPAPAGLPLPAVQRSSEVGAVGTVGDRRDAPTRSALSALPPEAGLRIDAIRSGDAADAPLVGGPIVPAAHDLSDLVRVLGPDRGPASVQRQAAGPPPAPAAAPVPTHAAPRRWVGLLADRPLVPTARRAIDSPPGARQAPVTGPSMGNVVATTTPDRAAAFGRTVQRAYDTISDPASAPSRPTGGRGTLPEDLVTPLDVPPTGGRPGAIATSSTMPVAVRTAGTPWHRSVSTPALVSAGPATDAPAVQRIASAGSAAVAAGVARADGENSVVFFSAPDQGGHQNAPASGTPSVQRDVAPGPAGAAAPPSTASNAAAPPAGTGPDAAGAGALQLDELARRLFDPLSARLKSELWLDRERAGMVTDVRR